MKKAYDKKVLDSIDSGIIVASSELEIIYWNRWMEMISGIQRDDAIGKRLFDVVEIEDGKLSALIRNIKVALRLNTITFMQSSVHGYLIKSELKNMFGGFYKDMRQDVKIVPLDTKKEIVTININDQTAIMESKKLLEDINKNLEGRIKIEVQKRVDAERMLLQQSKMALMGDMIGAIAHQWRQPLNALGLYIQDIPLAYKNGEIDEEYVEKLKNDAMRIIHAMSRTIDDFRNFFAPNKTKEFFEVEKALEETLKIIEVQIKNHHIDVRIKKSSNNNTICGYKNELEQVFLNLFSNSKDAILEKNPQDKFIDIKIESGDESVILLFEDSAGGIDDKILDRVFEPYFTTKEQGKGTGIGLYMSKQIIERHLGGTITVQNGEHGAKFRLEFKKQSMPQFL